MYESYQIQGGYRLAALLIKLPAEVERNIVVDAVKAGAQPMLDSAITHCPVYSGPPRADIVPGLLKASLKIKVTRAKGYARAAVQSGEGDFVGHTFYAMMVEFGHAAGNRPSSGTPDTRSAIPAHPFIRPAFDENRSKSAEIVAMEIARGIEAAAQ